MLLKFELKMPNVGSWNGVYAGERPANMMFLNVPKKKALELDGKSFWYDFEDGWGASVNVTRSKRTKTEGMSYDWMAYEIVKHGRIIPRKERIAARKAKEAALVTSNEG